MTIDGLTIANGLAPVDAKGNAFGGGLYINNGASVSLSEVVFASNQAVGPGAGGAAVANIGGHFKADHTTFSFNTSQSATDNFAFGAVLNDQNASTTSSTASSPATRPKGATPTAGRSASPTAAR